MKVSLTVTIVCALVALQHTVSAIQCGEKCRSCVRSCQKRLKSYENKQACVLSCSPESSDPKASVYDPYWSCIHADCLRDGVGLPKRIKSDADWNGWPCQRRCGRRKSKRDRFQSINEIQSTSVNCDEPCRMCRFTCFVTAARYAKDILLWANSSSEGVLSDKGFKRIVKSLRDRAMDCITPCEKCQTRCLSLPSEDRQRLCWRSCCPAFSYSQTVDYYGPYYDCMHWSCLPVNGSAGERQLPDSIATDRQFDRWPCQQNCARVERVWRAELAREANANCSRDCQACQRLCDELDFPYHRHTCKESCSESFADGHDGEKIETTNAGYYACLHDHCFANRKSMYNILKRPKISTSEPLAVDMSFYGWDCRRNCASMHYTSWRDYLSLPDTADNSTETVIATVDEIWPTDTTSRPTINAAMCDLAKEMLRALETELQLMSHNRMAKDLFQELESVMADPQQHRDKILIKPKKALVFRPKMRSRGNKLGHHDSAIDEMFRQLTAEVETDDNDDDSREATTEAVTVTTEEDLLKFGIDDETTETSDRHVESTTEVVHEKGDTKTEANKESPADGQENESDSDSVRELADTAEDTPVHHHTVAPKTSNVADRPTRRRQKKRLGRQDPHKLQLRPHRRRRPKPKVNNLGQNNGTDRFILEVYQKVVARVKNDSTTDNSTTAAPNQTNSPFDLDISSESIDTQTIIEESTTAVDIESNNTSGANDDSSETESTEIETTETLVTTKTTTTTSVSTNSVTTDSVTTEIEAIDALTTDTVITELSTTLANDTVSTEFAATETTTRETKLITNITAANTDDDDESSDKPLLNALPDFMLLQNDLPTPVADTVTPNEFLDMFISPKMVEREVKGKGKEKRKHYRTRRRKPESRPKWHRTKRTTTGGHFSSESVNDLETEIGKHFVTEAVTETTQKRTESTIKVTEIEETQSENEETLTETEETLTKTTVIMSTTGETPTDITKNLTKTTVTLTETEETPTETEETLIKKKRKQKPIETNETSTEKENTLTEMEKTLAEMEETLTKKKAKPTETKKSLIEMEKILSEMEENFIKKKEKPIETNETMTETEETSTEKEETLTKKRVKPTKAKETLTETEETPTEKDETPTEMVEPIIKRKVRPTKKKVTPTEDEETLTETAVNLNETDVKLTETEETLNRTAVTLSKTAVTLNQTAVTLTETVDTWTETDDRFDETMVKLNKTVVKLNETAIMLNKTGLELTETAVTLNRTATKLNQTVVKLNEKRRKTSKTSVTPVDDESDTSTEELATDQTVKHVSAKHIGHSTTEADEDQSYDTDDYESTTTDDETGEHSTDATIKSKSTLRCRSTCSTTKSGTHSSETTAKILRPTSPTPETDSPEIDSIVESADDVADDRSTTLKPDLANWLTKFFATSHSPTELESTTTIIESLNDAILKSIFSSISDSKPFDKPDGKPYDKQSQSVQYESGNDSSAQVVVSQSRESYDSTLNNTGDQSLRSGNDAAIERDIEKELQDSLYDHMGRPKMAVEGEESQQMADTAGDVKVLDSRVKQVYMRDADGDQDERNIEEIKTDTDLVEEEERRERRLKPKLIAGRDGRRPLTFAVNEESE